MASVKEQLSATNTITKESEMINQTTNVDPQEKEYMYWQELKASLERLEGNEDFKKVILEGYFKDKAVNGVSLLASPQIKQSGARGDIMEALVAISQLEDFFLTIKAMGEDIPEDDDEDLEE